MKTPQRIALHRKSRTLEVIWPEGSFTLPAEYLRVFSPSAEVRGHGRGQELLQHGKINVAITGVEAAGNYALKIIFDDGHDSGIYSWDYLYDLACNQQSRWQDYLQRLEAAGRSRDPDTSVVKFVSF